jgi:hypothetical protein
LKDSFPKLFCLARNKDAMIVDLRSVCNDTTHWDINFTRLVHDWEVDFVSSSMFYAPLEWVGRVMIAYVECAKKEDLLKSELFIRVHLLNGVFPFPWKSIGALRLF